MHVLIVTQYFWPENFRINDAARALVARGHRVTVLTGMPNYPVGKLFDGYRAFGPLRETWEGVEIVRSPLIPRGNGRAYRLIFNYASFVVSATLRGLFACRDRYDAIFVHEPSPITVALPAIVLRWLRRTPLALWVLDLWPDSVAAADTIRAGWALRLIDRLVRFIYRRCDSVLVQSRGFVDHVAARGVPRDRIHYFPSWAEDVFTAPPASPAGLPALPAGFRVMFAGNIGVPQDFPNILAAAERLRAERDIHWIVLGDGRMASWVREEITRRGLQETVHLLGRFPLDSMPAFFTQADAMLVTLKREPILALTIPAKVQSYLACGRPIVAMVDGEGARIVEQAGAGFACAAEDPAGLAAAVLKLRALDPAQRVRMGTAGRACYEREFAREALMTRLETHLATLSRMAA
jgi:glycosyltransferase involved in cell wall biosynthesis